MSLSPWAVSIAATWSYYTLTRAVYTPRALSRSCGKYCRRGHLTRAESTNDTRAKDTSDAGFVRAESTEDAEDKMGSRRLRV